ncbi:MOSC domain-containing protein [Rhizobium sp. SG2393]|uniref:MOSC domain-containing protein n=1 Tax=Rhizobium sp. SG2393 TaxID=3276279 RepID=UPI003672EE14
MKVAGLNIHPLKSARAIPLQSVLCRLDGFADDRRFLLTEPDGAAITQRELQMLAQVTATPVPGGVALTLGERRLTVTFDPARRRAVSVWGTPIDAALAEDAINDTLSGWFGRPVALAHMDALARRGVNDPGAGADAAVGFADEYPILVTTTASLADLNTTLAEKGQPPVGMDRFRTNILIENETPWDEDLWEAIEIGGLRFDLLKPCTRCIMTTQDQMTGERIGGNPVEALAVKRMSADRRVSGVLFGWNAVVRGEGRLGVGDTVTVLSRRAERWPLRVRN